MKIHKEGRRILFFTLLALLAANLLLFRYNADNRGFNQVFAGISVIMFLILLQFFPQPGPPPVHPRRPDYRPGRRQGGGN